MADEKSNGYRGFTEAQARAHKKYIAQFVEIKIRTTPERRETIQNAAASQGQSVNAYINQAIDERMTRDGGGVIETVTAPESPSASGGVLTPAALETAAQAAQNAVQGG